MKWDESNPLADQLVSFLYFTRGQWHESGPYGGQMQPTQSGTSSDYRVNDQRLGSVEAIQYGTVDGTSGSNFRFIYPRSLHTVNDSLTVFSLAYTTVANSLRKGEVLYMNSGATLYNARTVWGNSSNQDRQVDFQHSGAVVSFCRTGGTYAANTPGFVSASKAPATAVSPLGYASGVLMGTVVNQNAAWISESKEVYVGRLISASAASQLNGGVALFGLFTRALTDSEHLSLYDNPWQLVRPTRSARIFDFGTAAAAGSTTPIFRHHYVQQGIA